jgi:hypothetical protein
VWRARLGWSVATPIVRPVLAHRPIENVNQL